MVKAPGGGFDGYQFTVHIPAFNGAISSLQNNGDATLHGAAAAKSSTVHTGVGDITADNTPAPSTCRAAIAISP